MKATALSLCVTFCCLLRVSPLDIRLPPSILTNPVPLKIYRSDDEITLDCIASGFPKPEYEWRKNGEVLQIPGAYSNIHQISDGTIRIDPLTGFDEGSYQCTAFNQYGRTVSQQTTLQRAVLAPYSPNIPDFDSPTIEEGQTYMLPCQPIKCFPKPTFSWAVSATKVDTEHQAIKPDRRVQVDDDGNLHFSYVTTADAHSGKLYRCNVYNPYMDVTMGGSYSKLNVLRAAGGVRPFGPTLLFSSPSTMVALQGKNVTLRCFFSGNPEPMIQWSNPKGLPVGRITTSNFNTELTIRDVQQSDEGTYTCRVSNGQGSADASIHIGVQAPPVFLSEADRPHNVNVTNGQSVSIRCKTYAEPAAKVMWFVNAEKLDPSSLPPRFRLSSDLTNLTITNVCRDCKDGSSDIRVIQCNASNANGQVFSDGYVNILKETQLDVVPVDVAVGLDDVFASFNCSATSDDSTPTTVSWWHRFPNEEDSYERVLQRDGQVIIERNGSLSFRVAGNLTEWREFQGQYKCVASNGYSVMEATAELIVHSTEDPPVIASVAASFPWWIFIILAIILLLLIIIICCCCCLHRNKGETYPVDEKERKNGHDPEKELADSGFHDYIRPEKAILKGSRASLASSMRSRNSLEDLSLNEYGDLDAGKFTEDGSFIGDYGNRAYV